MRSLTLIASSVHYIQKFSRSSGMLSTVYLNNMRYYATKVWPHIHAKEYGRRYLVGVAKPVQAVVVTPSRRINVVVHQRLQSAMSKNFRSM